MTERELRILELKGSLGITVEEYRALISMARESLQLRTDYAINVYPGRDRIMTRLRVALEESKRRVVIVEQERESLCNRWLEQAENLAKDHARDDGNETWDDDESYGAYRTLIGCRADLTRLAPRQDETSKSLLNQ